MLVRWNPWNDFSRFDKELATLFGRNGEAARVASWQPAVDIREDAQKIQIVADLPGVEQKDVDISVEKNVLTLRGERKTESPADADAAGFHRYERVSGSFARAFTLPTTVETDKVTAEMKAGVLTLTLPKKAQAQPQKIKVNVA